jgi:carboxypeptidase PM20D1
MNRPKQKLQGAISAALLVAALSAQAQDFSSMQMQGVEQMTIEVDVDAAAERLSRAVQFPTISNQDRSDFDTEAFEGYHEFLEQAYPGVHKTLEKELLGDPRPYSLLYTWEQSVVHLGGQGPQPAAGGVLRPPGRSSGS